MECFERPIGTSTAKLCGNLHGLEKTERGIAPRPAILIFPGSNFTKCSPWEDEPLAMAYLAEADFVTGNVLNVDGGFAI